MTETKCKGQAERLGFMAEDVQSLIELAEQVCEDMEDEAVWGKPDDPEQLNNEIGEVQITISALKSCLAAINNSRLTEQSVSRLQFEKEGEQAWDGKG